jgi:hypothetical protein
MLLLTIFGLVITAYPRFRMVSRNTFENFHRLGFWFSLGLFGVQSLLFTQTQYPSSLDGTVIKFLAFWFLLMPTIHAIPPLVPPPQIPRCGREHSNHAIHLHFNEKIALVRHQISASPFKEWHSFTCIPAREGPGGSLLTSNAGDWTWDATETLQPYH